MSVKIMTAVWAIELPASQKIVLLALADSANDEGHCWPGIASLSAKCSKSERTTQAMLCELEAAGHITRNQVPGKGCNYTVHPRKICTPEETAPVQKLRKPPQISHLTPAKSAPKPSLNHQEPSKTQTKRACQMPDDWVPVDWPLGSTCRGITDEWPPGEYETQVEHFTAHHRAKGSRFMDWQDAWKTWVLNSRKWNNRNGKSHAGIQRAAGKPVDGVALALDRRLGLGDPANEAGRRDAGEGSGHRGLAIAPARAVR